MGQRYGFPPALGVQSFTWLRLPLALTSACQLGKKSFEISVFIRSSVPDALDRPAAFSLRQRLGGSYSIKMVECPQVSGSFWRCKHGFSQWDTWKERSWWLGGVGGRSPALTQPRQTSLRDATAWSRQETPSLLLSRQVFLWYLPLTRPLGVWQRQQQTRVPPGTSASPRDPRQPRKHPHHSHGELGPKPVLDAKLSTPLSPVWPRSTQRCVI